MEFEGEEEVGGGGGMRSPPPFHFLAVIKFFKDIILIVNVLNGS